MSFSGYNLRPRRQKVFAVSQKDNRQALIEKLSRFIIRGPWFTCGLATAENNGDCKTRRQLKRLRNNLDKRSRRQIDFRLSFHDQNKSITDSSNNVIEHSRSRIAEFVQEKPRKHRIPRKPQIPKTATSDSSSKRSLTKSSKNQSKVKSNKKKLQNDDKKKPKGTKVFPELSEVLQQQSEKVPYPATISITPNLNPIKLSPVHSKDQTRAIDIYKQLKTAENYNSLILSQFEASQIILDSDSGSNSDYDSDYSDSMHLSIEQILSDFTNEENTTPSSSFSDLSDNYRSNAFNTEVNDETSIPRIKADFNDLIEIAKWCTPAEEDNSLKNITKCTT